LTLTDLPVEHLFTLTAATTNATQLKGAPQGDRLLVTVASGTFEGPRLKGTIDGGGGDWVTMRADGSAKLDVRITLRTDDGAAILMTYAGIGQVQDGAFVIRSAPLFETGDERYTWLNNLQAVGLGQPGQGTVTYEVYALK
jgi:hypothetical protein